jgi:hypothetical protein
MAFDSSDARISRFSMDSSERSSEEADVAVAAS